MDLPKRQPLKSEPYPVTGRPLRPGEFGPWKYLGGGFKVREVGGVRLDFTEEGARKRRLEVWLASKRCRAGLEPMVPLR
jgi:hypothetical protein